jgi:septal ring factor EnvC (AmiA/AmiB activator)
MTVPGKGGRPRKWRSDADRVRAFRARERGEKEPPTLDTALVDGDELALAVDRARCLQAELVDAIASMGELEEALAGERRRTDAVRRRLDRTQADLDRQQSAAAATGDQIRSLQAELAEVRAANADLKARLAILTQPPTGPVLNRAARRAAKRDRKDR